MLPAYKPVPSEALDRERQLAYSFAKRLFDIVAVLAAGVVLLPVALVVAAAVKLTSRGSVLYWSQRVAAGGGTFAMPKFRTMREGTPAVATHLLKDANSALTPIGGFLRRSSLDEIPQLWSILTGDMSLVGPRPALFNQDDLVALRREAGVDSLTPGLTGWAQVNGRDDLPIPAKVRFEQEYRERQSLWFDLRIIVLTARKVLLGSGVKH